MSQNHTLILPPEGIERIPLIVDSPHSGRDYPADFNHACRNETTLRALHSLEDRYVEELIAGAPQLGAAFLQALFPRSYIDPNRAESDILPEIVEEPWTGGFRLDPTRRSRAGYGLIMHHVPRDRVGHYAVYDRRLPTKEILHRITDYYAPYHAALNNEIQGLRSEFGACWHLNWHSMPNSAVEEHRGLPDMPAIGFVLGTLDGKSCSPEFTKAIRHFIESLGYRVLINTPFSGAEILEKYGRPTANMYSLQIEINRRLYMDETTGAKNKNFDKLKADIDKILQFAAEYVQHQIAAAPIPRAAE